MIHECLPPSSILLARCATTRRCDGATASTSISDLLGGFSFAFHLGHFLDSYPCDAVTFHLLDRIAAAFELEGIAQHRDALQAGEDEPRERFESRIAGQGYAVLSLQVSYIHGTFQHQHRFVLESGLAW